MKTHAPSPSPEYLAGFLDGEGSFSLTRQPNGTSWSARVSVSLTHKPTLVSLQEVFGGTVFAKPRHHNPTWKDCWTWNLNSSAARKVTEQVLPYLITKQAAASKLLEFMDLPKLHKGRPKGWKPGETYNCSCEDCLHTLAERERIAAELASLNQRGRRSP